MSLAQLGKGHVTAPAIYLIETGRTRPSLPTLEHIARRTGKPVEFFLAEPAGGTDEGRARLLELEAMVEDGRFTDAVALARALMDHPPSAFALGRIRYLMAQAYIGLGNAERAAPLLSEARAHFEAINEGVMLAATTGSQAALAIATQPKEALALAETALNVLRAQKPVPQLTEGRLLAILGDACAANQDWERAAAAYEESIKVGGSTVDLRRTARKYTDLATVYHDAGEVERAGRFAMRAIALLEILGERSMVARSEQRLAAALVARGDLERAREHLERSVSLSSELGQDSGLTEALLNLCDVSWQEGKVDEARDFAVQALERAQGTENGAAAAESRLWLGRIADRQGDHEQADRDFEQAIHGFEALGLRERLLHTHGVYAEILERRGELARAYGHMKQALQVSRPGPIRRDEEEERASTA